MNIDKRKNRNVRVEINNNPRALSEKLKYLREKMNLTQEQVAAKLQITRQRYSQFENNYAQMDLFQAQTFFDLVNEKCPYLHVNGNIFFNDNEFTNLLTAEDLNNLKLNEKAIAHINELTSGLKDVSEISIKTLNAFLGCEEFVGIIYNISKILSQNPNIQDLDKELDDMVEYVIDKNLNKLKYSFLTEYYNIKK